MKRRLLTLAVLVATSAFSGGCFTYTAMDNSGTWLCEPVQNLPYFAPETKQRLVGFYACMQQEPSGLYKIKIVDRPF